jgi:hypothetical protein
VCLLAGGREAVEMVKDMFASVVDDPVTRTGIRC